ncbi:cell division protein DivIB [Lysinibacillus fusiformis]|uniref:Cell division protein DivIB n=1 Tax=Lysinibacillus fusiformis TaxID=28031 RepID=A0A1H9DIZ0_9BACI|nr:MULTISPECIES: cell division protein FtsQ/DivIB [Lysinibacillus]EAZ87390.1 cell-division initiation protein (septum formation) [Bacillus sp. B14905]AJK89087.1 cell division protein DivIB [Lysinibacillus fusiformis]KGA82689.1 cell division protein DivIB [Lysinibacillus fusiformis]KHK52475.1 cell division protein DivIB [Lysinibacillus sp. A1]MCE4043784.1 FtsQ-type POTRA domain-containing protein [Lysinibacillus fusiformis]
MEKVIDIEDRIPTLKKRRKKRTNRKFIVLILLFFIVLAVLLYFQSPYSNINKITVNGAKLVDNEHYVETSTLALGKSMWGFKIEDVENLLLKDKWVKEAHVKRNWLRGVTIDVKEWKKVAYLAGDGTYYPLLENGERFEQKGNDTPIDAPVFIGITGEKTIKKLVAQLAQLKPEVLALISQVNTNSNDTNPNAVKLYMNDGYEVRAIIQTLADKLNYYPSIVAQIANLEKGVIDLEVGSYYRPFNEEYNKISIDMEANEDGEMVDQEVTEDEQQEE